MEYILHHKSVCRKGEGGEREVVSCIPVILGKGAGDRAEVAVVFGKMCKGWLIDRWEVGGVRMESAKVPFCLYLGKRDGIRSEVKGRARNIGRSRG